jgi:oligoendopeptidase F
MYRPFLEDKDVINDIYQTIATDWEKEATEIREYTHSREMRTSGQDITPEAVDALLQAVTDNKDVFQEYFELKTGYLSEKQGIEANRYDIYAPLEELDADIPYEEAKQTVLNNLKDFDQRFYDAAKSVFDAGHVDSHPRKTKRSGAFCMSSPTGVAPYVMLNYDGTARDVSTMAHELGHAIHDVFVDEAQTPLNRHPTIPMAETASVFAEQVLFEQLLEQRPDDRLELLNQFLSDQFATILRQSYFTLFEERAHAKIAGGARREELEEIYLELLQGQFGDLNIPEQFKDEWLLIPHIFRVPFYCYAYSWGNLLVLSLYDVYKEQGERFKDRYVELLRAGKSQSPQDIVSAFGFDLEDPAFWDRGFKLIRERLDEFKSLV